MDKILTMIQKFTKHLLVRYIISGGTSAFINLSVFFLLFQFFKVYYIIASVVAFVISFLISLVLQKFWTFQDHSTENMHLQVGKYLLSSLFGLAINTGFLYVFVDFAHIHPFIGQILAGGLTACCTFFISRKYVFNQI